MHHYCVNTQCIIEIQEIYILLRLYNNFYMGYKPKFLNGRVYFPHNGAGMTTNTGEIEEYNFTRDLLYPDQGRF